VLFHGRPGAPEINQADPLSAIIMPYFFIRRELLDFRRETADIEVRFEAKMLPGWVF